MLLKLERAVAEPSGCMCVGTNAARLGSCPTVHDDSTSTLSLLLMRKRCRAYYLTRSSNQTSWL
jgi:hypothetical protein